MDSTTTDTDLLLSLGANIVDREQFENDLVVSLEQRLQEQSTSQNVDDQQDNAIETVEEADDSSEFQSGSGSILYNRLLQRPPDSIATGLEITTEDEQRPLHKETGFIGSIARTGENRTDRVGVASENVRNANVQNPTLVPEETEHEKRVRWGEVTPFGTGIEGDASTTKKDTFMNFNKYLQHQLNLQETMKANKSKSTSGAKGHSKGHGHKKTTKDPLNMSIMFPKKRKRKETFGLDISEDPRDGRRRPGKSLAETTSTYLNSSDDSDYLPSESEEEEPQPSSSKSVRKTARKPKLQKKVLKDKSSNEDSSDYYDSDYDRPTKRLKKEADDGDQKYYLMRVQQWKEHETRVTGEFHTFEGGFKLPIHMWESLYTYQKVGVKWLWELHQQRCGGILGDEMGLGKTIEVINFLTGIACSKMMFRFTGYRGLGPVLLVTPATVMHQWVKEFHTWWPPFRVAVLHESGSFSGTKASLIKTVILGKGILVTSYSGLVNNQDEILKHAWHYVILDEGHKIRNPDAQITLVVKQVKTPHRLILSGSPLQNNLKELWSLFDFVYPGKLGTLPTFMEQFAVPITHGGYSNATQVQVAVAYKCAKALRDLINPYLLRRMKSDVKDHINLPEKNEQVLFCKMTDGQKDLYKSYVASKEIDSIIQGRFNLFVGLINLRKICNHPHLFDGGPKIIAPNPKYAKHVPKVKSDMNLDDSLNIEDEGSDIEIDPSDGSFGHWSKSGKMVVVETLLKLWHAQGHKVLLFTQSRQMLCILENFIRQCRYSYLRLDGGTSISSRQPLISKFNEDPNIFIFILTTRVGGLGVNLTAANRVILYDPDWNPSTDIQARERAWRIGQLRQVTIYRLILSGTIEEKMYHRQIFKQFLTNRVLKDPKQKRFFKSNDMLELFTFNEGTRGTESEAIFAGTGSSIEVKKSKRKDKEPQPRERPSGRFRDVPNLVKQSRAKLPPTEVTEEENNSNQDEYVLRKLFSKSGPGVQAALRHDKIVDTDEADYMIVEKEAEGVAKKAIETLKRSREQCWDAESGYANWTGNQGIVKQPVPKPPPLRFGKKKATSTIIPSSTALTSTSTTSQQSGDIGDKYFTGESLFNEVATNKKLTSVTSTSGGDAVMTSSDLLAIIRARKGSMPIPENTDGSTPDVNSGPELKSEQLELIQDIREFIAFQATIDGQATTDELIAKFGPRLPGGQSPLFKQMLNQLCTFRRVEGRGLWRLKPEFR